MRIYLDNCCYNRPYDDMSSMAEIMDIGFACLVERMGVVNAERFVAMIKRESFDYTIWRKEYFKNMDLKQIREEAAAYEEAHPFKGKAVRL